MEEENGYEKAVYGDGETKLEVDLDPGRWTVWLTKRQLSQLYGIGVDAVSFHLKNLYSEGELGSATAEESSVVRLEGVRSVRRRQTVYNLDAVLALGRRIRSDKGEKLARWLNDQLTEKSQNNRIPIIFDNGDLQINAFASPRENTVWIGMEELANLFEVDRSVVSRHIKNIYSEGESEEGTTCAKNAHMVYGRSYQTKPWSQWASCAA